MESVRTHAGDLFPRVRFCGTHCSAPSGELFRWKRQGVRICFFVYDLLPVLEPSWFTLKTTQNVRRWLRALAILADDVIAISRTVKTDFAAWMLRNYDLNERDLPCASIQMGTGLNTSSSSQHAIMQRIHLPPQLVHRKFVLMVGTIEPRKGHADVLDGFDSHWAAGNQTNLVIAGKRGWKVAPLIRRFQTHSDMGKRLHWLNDPSDEVLLALYQHCIGVIVASKGEGLGLPLIEAAYFNKPVLARDIPIFREICGDAATYFSTTGDNRFMQALPKWLTKLEALDQVSVVAPAWVAWRESGVQLVRVLHP